MDAERERRARWWAEPLDDPPNRLTIRNIARDETVVIQLDGAAARKKRKPMQDPAAPWLWWDEET